MGLAAAAAIADPVGLNATTSMASLAARTATQRPVVSAGVGARTPGVGVRGADAARAREPLAPSKAQIEDFMRSIKGFDQTKASEYESPAQARTWGYSSCSAASLTAVLRAAGKDVKVADVMREMPNGMTVALGLVSRPALVNAANSFGAKATDDVTTYDKLRAATEAGQPVLVDLRNRKFPEGHFVVVTGVDADGVRVADSSRYDLTHIPHGEFMSAWSGKGIRVDGLVPTRRPNLAQPGAPAIKTA
jgi:predicted double-glycine peptidase